VPPFPAPERPTPIPDAPPRSRRRLIPSVLGVVGGVYVVLRLIGFSGSLMDMLRSEVEQTQVSNAADDAAPALSNSAARQQLDEDLLSPEDSTVIAGLASDAGAQALGGEFGLARAAAATLRQASGDPWTTIMGSTEGSEDSGGIGWTIREKVLTDGPDTLRYRSADYTEGGDCSVAWGVLLRNDIVLLVDTWAGCAVEMFPNTFTLDSLFVEPGQAPAAFHFDETNQGMKPGTEEYRWTTEMKPIADGAKIARLREGARAILAADTVAMGRVIFTLHQ
jgi:hypothetical protein